VQAFSLAEAHDWAGIDALAPLRSGSALRARQCSVMPLPGCCRSTPATTSPTSASCSATRLRASTRSRTTMPCTNSAWWLLGRRRQRGRRRGPRRP
jgi:hypothetical protein